MSSANLANLNVDALFEQHSIAEIDIVQKKIQTVIEKKREELRTLVGERYRDLLKAADTIATMRESSSELSNQIDKITANCRSLNEKQLIGFQTDDTDAIKSRTANKQLNNYFSTVMQIKLLTTLPEMIWSHIDDERFYLATELFIFSRHISTGLQLDADNTLMQHFPVAKKQWEILKPFHLTIKQSVLATLEREELSPEAATDCLISLLLLEKGNLNGILKTFVQLRCSAFLTSMVNAGGDQKRVKDRILGSLRVINSTVQLVHKCFFENNKGLVTLRLEELQHAMPTISHIDCHDSQFAYLLPDIIANFRPKFDSLSLKEDQVKATIETWLNESSNIAGVHLKTLFNLVSSMKIIQEIKKESMVALKQDPSWSYICERFGIGQKLDFYQFQYKPLINQRIRDIIRQSWVKANDGMFKRIENVLNTTNLTSTNRKINDLWIESAGDLPLSLKDALSEDRKIKKLLMKAKGFDADIISICSEFNEHLAGIVCEMKLLLEEQETTADEKRSLVEFLKETSEEQIRELMVEVTKANCDKQLQQLLFLVRLLAAIVELCPNLRACLSQSYYEPTNWTTQPVAEKKTLENWTRVCNLLEDEGFALWKRVCELILDENPVISKRIGHETILEDFANWETVTIEQKDEQDNPVQSTFRIPSQPRISLQQYLFSVTNALNLYIPQTLPQKILHVFNTQLIQRLIEHYKSLVQDDKFTASSQSAALQLYYDAKFLQAVFTSRDDRSLVDGFNSITNLLKDFIDPFDFELFSEHISLNVKKSVLKMHCQLGVIIPHLLQNTSSHVQQEKDPNVLTLSSNGSTSIWFPLLPIITPGSAAAAAQNTPTSSSKSSTTPMHTEVEKTPTRRSNRKADTSRSHKTGAAAFFGAMSQEWFR